MIPVVVPQEDINSETAVLVAWLADDESYVEVDAPICEVETTKTIFVVSAPGEGWLVRGNAEGDEVPFNVPIAYLVETEDAVPEARKRLRAPDPETAASDAPAEAFAGKITAKARQLLEKHEIPITRLPDKAIVTERDVLALVNTKDDYFSSLDEHVYVFPHESARVLRTLVLGAGLGAMQVVDILQHDARVEILGYVDDHSNLHGKTIYGLPVLGAPSLVEEWFRAGRCDAAIISVSTSNEVRRRWYEQLKQAGIPLVNAIDPTVKANRGVVLGEGNVVCAFVHFGVETRIGNNNFISAYNSVDHHNIWGSHITTGPGIATSGCVTIGDDVKMGTGIFIQPYVEIGRGAQIASGAVLTRSVPELYAAKVRVNAELTPIRRTS